MVKYKLFVIYVEATVIQWRQTKTRRSNKVDWTNFTNKSQRVSKSAHWSTASRYDFLIDTSSSLDASVEVTSSLLSRGLSSLWRDSGLNIYYIDTEDWILLQWGTNEVLKSCDCVWKIHDGSHAPLCECLRLTRQWLVFHDEESLVFAIPTIRLSIVVMHTNNSLFMLSTRWGSATSTMSMSSTRTPRFTEADLSLATRCLFWRGREHSWSIGTAWLGPCNPNEKLAPRVSFLVSRNDFRYRYSWSCHFEMKGTTEFCSNGATIEWRDCLSLKSFRSHGTSDDW
jgi:hypothetical protein